MDQVVSKLEKEKDEAVADFKGMMEGNQDSATDLLNEADGVMDVVDKLFALCESWFGGAKAAAKSEELDLQKLHLSARTPAEKNLAKYSALGKVLVSGVQHAVGALPFGGPIAAALGAIFCRAVTVRSCRPTPLTACHLPLLPASVITFVRACTHPSTPPPPTTHTHICMRTRTCTHTPRTDPPYTQTHTNTYLTIHLPSWVILLRYPPSTFFVVC